MSAEAADANLPSASDVWTIEFCMDTFFLDAISFVDNWVAAARNPEFEVSILFTRREDLARDAQGFFAQIAEFYGIDPALLRAPEAPEPGVKHFRRGEVKEWRELLSPTQRQRAAKLLPDHLLQAFDWPRE